MKRRLFALGIVSFFILAGCTEKKETPENKTPLNEILELKRINQEPNFTGLDSFSAADGLARAEKNALYGYIDTSGKEIVPIKNYNVQTFSEGLGLVEATEGHFYFVDKTGKKVIDLAGYENAFSFIDGYATVAKKEGYGLINKTGKEVIPCTSGIGIFPLSPGNFIAEMNGKKAVLNAQGQPTLPFKDFGDIYYDKDNNQYAFNDGKNWVIAAPDGTIKTRIDADGLIFNDGAYFLSKTTDTAGTVNAVMNNKGEMTVPYGKYYSINTRAPYGRICVGSKTGETPSGEAGITNVNENVGYVDLTGKVVIPMQFQDAMIDFCEGLAAVLINDKMGYIDTMGKLVIPATFDKAGNFQNGYAKVENSGVVSYIDKTGKEVY